MDVGKNEGKFQRRYNRMGNYSNTWLKGPQVISLYKTFAIESLIEKQRVQFPTLSIIPTSFPRYGEQEKIKGLRCK